MREGGRLIGNVHFAQSESKSLLTWELDYIFNRQYQGKGYGSQRIGENPRSSVWIRTPFHRVRGERLRGRWNGYGYRLKELQRVARESREFVLEHRLFRSDHTGEVIHNDLLRLAYPPCWKYDILRCLDYFRSVGMPWDDRMSDALEVLDSKRRPNGRWPLQAAHPGQLHFQMEEPGKPSGWNTLLALRVFRACGA